MPPRTCGTPAATHASLIQYAMSSGGESIAPISTSAPGSSAAMSSGEPIFWSSATTSVARIELAHPVSGARDLRPSYV